MGGINSNKTDPLKPIETTNNKKRDKFKEVFKKLYNKFKRTLTIQHLMAIFIEAKDNAWYTNRDTSKGIAPLEMYTKDLNIPENTKQEMRKFSVEFQNVCAVEGIMSPRNNNVGLRTKRFLNEAGFVNNKDVEDWIQNQWVSAK